MKKVTLQLIPGFIKRKEIRELIAELHPVFDDSFESFRSSNRPVYRNYEESLKYRVAHHLGVDLDRFIMNQPAAIEVANVPPHSDDHYTGEPLCGTFLLLKGKLSLYVIDPTAYDGVEVAHMKPGDLALFDDTKKHFVMADKRWKGLAVQASLI